MLTDPYEKSENKARVVDILFIDYGNVSRGVSVEGIFALPKPDHPRFGGLLDPVQIPGFAVGPHKPVADKGGAQIDNLISVRNNHNLFFYK